MNLDDVKARMGQRDRWMLLSDEERSKVLSALADDVPGLVSEIEKFRGAFKMMELVVRAHPCNNPHCSCRDVRVS